MPAASFGQADRLQNLEPGKRAELNEKVPVNFVFVGYERGAIDAGKFLARLPTKYKPVVRSKYLNNKSIPKSLLGLNYTYDYNVKFADGGYEKKLFQFLSGASRPAPLTDFQKLYNGNPRSYAPPPRKRTCKCAGAALHGAGDLPPVRSEEGCRTDQARAPVYKGLVEHQASPQASVGSGSMCVRRCGKYSRRETRWRTRRTTGRPRWRSSRATSTTQASSPRRGL